MHLPGGSNAARRAPAKQDRSVLNLVVVPKFTVLAEGFVEDDACCVGKVQTAVELSRHGDPAEIIFVTLMKFLRQTGGFSAENEIVPLLKLHIKKVFVTVSGDEKHPFRLIFFDKSFPVRVDRRSEIFPVVQSGAFEKFIFERKSQRFDQVESAVGRNRQTADGSGILGNFRSVKDNVEGSHRYSNFLILAANRVSQL